MRPLRVFIVDDSAVIRKLLSEVLAADAEIEIAGTAGNGDLALARIREAKPDLVTLDIEMPGMDGLATITEIRKFYPKLPVIMFSSFTERGGLATLEALSRGASDYVTKPKASSIGQARERVRAELIPKIKCLCSASEGLPVPAAAPSRIALPRLQSRIDIVAIGASTGGPPTLWSKVSSIFPQNFRCLWSLSSTCLHCLRACWPNASLVLRSRCGRGRKDNDYRNAKPGSRRAIGT